MSKRRWPRERLETSRIDEQAIVHCAYRSGSGGTSAEVRVIGAFDVDGKRYEFNRVITIAAKPVRSPAVAKAEATTP